MSAPTFTLYIGDAVDNLRHMDSESVNCIVTSPPYWKMRDYAVEGQLGQEATPGLYAQHLTTVFTEARRVLRKDGVFWLNIGDKFLRKQLAGIPHIVKDALRADGWFFRMEVVWHKTNVRPESAKDRPTHAHEYVFMFTRGAKYHYDAKAIEEPAKWERWGDQTVDKYEGTGTATGWMKPKTKAELSQRTTRNKRSVWSIPTANYPGFHDAVFPAKLVEPCILATCPDGGHVLDPFIGSGTTAEVALALDRNVIGIELSPDSAKEAINRVSGGRA